MRYSDSVSICLRKYATLDGRASRSEYWWFALFAFAASSLAGTIGPKFAIVVSLAILPPAIAVSVRRLHDTNHRGWFLLLLLVPLVGWIVLTVFALRESKEPNRFSTEGEAEGETQVGSADQITAPCEPIDIIRTLIELGVVAPLLIGGDDNPTLHLSDNADQRVFHALADTLQECFSGQWITKASDLDQDYWDIRIDNQTLTLHQEHYGGISLFPEQETFDPDIIRSLLVRIREFLASQSAPPQDPE